jgi:glycosyltransferase involved in cell wall biosynthesis
MEASAPVRDPLPIYPGHGSASLQIEPHARIGYIIGEEKPDRIALLVRSVYLAQRSRRNFSPLFVTASSYFLPFIQHGYVFEYVPEALTRTSAGDGSEGLLQKRLAFIKAKWGIHEFADLRAADHHRLAEGAGRKPRIVVYPDYGQANPYLKMMYADCGEYELLHGSIQEAAELARTERVIFHLHWEDATFRDVREDCVPVVLADFVASVDRLRHRGGRFIWTVHNLEPHDVADKRLSSAFSQQLLARADCIHVHSEWMAAEIRARSGPHAPIVVVEHPSYAGCYPDATSAEVARARLGLSEDDVVFLCLGQVRRYKGIEHLLNLAPEFAGRATFVIAGRSGRYDPRGAPPENCLCIDEHVADETVSDLYSAADFAVLPFEESTTSGSLLLALSFGAPVIAPTHEEISRIVRDGREGFLYPVDDARGLREALERALRTPAWKRSAMRESARAAAAFRPPAAFSSRIREMIDACASRAPAASDAPGGSAFQAAPDVPLADAASGPKGAGSSGRRRRRSAGSRETVSRSSRRGMAPQDEGAIDALPPDRMDGAVARALNGNGNPKQTRRVEEPPGGAE